MAQVNNKHYKMVLAKEDVFSFQARWKYVFVITDPKQRVFHSEMMIKPTELRVGENMIPAETSYSEVTKFVTDLFFENFDHADCIRKSVRLSTILEEYFGKDALDKLPELFCETGNGIRIERHNACMLNVITGLYDLVEVPA